MQLVTNSELESYQDPLLARKIERALISETRIYNLMKQNKMMYFEMILLVLWASIKVQVTSTAVWKSNNSSTCHWWYNLVQV